MSDLRGLIEAGDVFTVECPYVRELVSLPGDEGSYETWTWRPGVVFETEVRNFYGEREEVTFARAHGMGTVTYSVVSTHTPSPFPTRVFFTRRWRDPDGREFGKSRLLIQTVGQFKRRARGFVPGGTYGDGYVVEDMSDADRRALLNTTEGGEA